MSTSPVPLDLDAAAPTLGSKRVRMARSMSEIEEARKQHESFATGGTPTLTSTPAPATRTTPAAHTSHDLTDTDTDTSQAQHLSKKRRIDLTAGTPSGQRSSVHKCMPRTSVCIVRMPRPTMICSSVSIRVHACPCLYMYPFVCSCLDSAAGSHSTPVSIASLVPIKPVGKCKFACSWDTCSHVHVTHINTRHGHGHGHVAITCTLDPEPYACTCTCTCMSCYMYMSLFHSLYRL